MNCSICILCPTVTCAIQDSLTKKLVDIFRLGTWRVRVMFGISYSWPATQNLIHVV